MSQSLAGSASGSEGESTQELGRERGGVSTQEPTQELGGERGEEPTRESTQEWGREWGEEPTLESTQERGRERRGASTLERRGEWGVLSPLRPRVCHFTTQGMQLLLSFSGGVSV
jgi:hypothetical protein